MLHNEAMTCRWQWRRQKIGSKGQSSFNTIGRNLQVHDGQQSKARQGYDCRCISITYTVCASALLQWQMSDTENVEPENEVSNCTPLFFLFPHFPPKQLFSFHVLHFCLRGMIYCYNIDTYTKLTWNSAAQYLVSSIHN